MKVSLDCKISHHIVEPPLLAQLSLCCERHQNWHSEEAGFREYTTVNARMLRLDFSQLEKAIYVLHF